MEIFNALKRHKKKRYEGIVRLLSTELPVYEWRRRVVSNVDVEPKAIHSAFKKNRYGDALKVGL